MRGYRKPLVRYLPPIKSLCGLLAALTLAIPAQAEPAPWWVPVLEHGPEIAEAWLEQAARERKHDEADEATYEPPLPREPDDPPEASVWPKLNKKERRR